MATADALVVPRFYIHTTKNEGKSKEAGRPIFDDMEVVEVRFAGNRQTVSVFPAHAICGQTQGEDGDFKQMTYAERWPDQYRRFKAKAQQVAEGTPVDELPFLTQAKRSELKALSIYTAESLAALDGAELKNLGQGGRELKNQAQAYLDNASGSANVTKMASEIEELKRTVADLTAGKPSPFDHDGDGNPGGSLPAESVEPSPFAEWDAGEIKDWIKKNGGSVPKGNASHVTLVKAANDLNAKRSQETE